MPWINKASGVQTRQTYNQPAPSSCNYAYWSRTTLTPAKFLYLSAALFTPREPACSCYMHPRIRCCELRPLRRSQSLRLFVSSCLVEACTYRKVSRFLRYVSFRTGLPPSSDALPDTSAASAAIDMSRSAHMILHGIYRPQLLGRSPWTQGDLAITSSLIEQDGERDRKVDARPCTGTSV